MSGRPRTTSFAESCKPVQQPSAFGSMKVSHILSTVTVYEALVYYSNGDPRIVPVDAEAEIIEGDKDGSKVTTVVATPGQGPDRPQEVSYTDTKVIGNGSFGVVYQAKLCDSGELVAIKKVLQDKRFKQGQEQGQGNPKQKYRLDREWFENSPEEKDSGMLVKKLDMTQQCALSAQKAKRILGCIKSSVDSRSREGILSLYSALMRSHLEFCQAWGHRHKKNRDLLGYKSDVLAVFNQIFNLDEQPVFFNITKRQETVWSRKVVFNRELQIMRKLDHCNIVRLRYFFYSSGEKKDEVYLNLVLDYVPETVYRVARHYSRAKQTLPMIYVKLYMYQLFRSLAYIHSFGICHRDIKPQNLLLDPDTAVLKLCDFGSAKQLVRGEPNVSYICSRYYRAPELIFGATDYTSSIDVWSAGCVLAELLLGQPIFPGDSGVDQLVEIIKVLGTPTREQIREMNPNYTEFKFPQIKAHPWTKVFRPRTPPEAIALCSRLLEYTPTARLTPLEACAHSFFDELRDPNVKLPNGRDKPALFNFTTQELSSNPSLASILIPAHARNQAAASTPTNATAASGNGDQKVLYILYLGQGNPKHKYRLDREWFESSPEEKDLGVLSDRRLDMSLQHILCCIKSTASRLGELILPLFSTVVRPHLEYCVHLWGPQHKGVNLLERVQRRVMKMLGGLEHLLYEDRLRELGLFNLKKRRLWGDFRAPSRT
ncbi:hypothetical protein BTVI_106113 [Pitangus sulphuratus]|nr:hypothetical protein BTVI_106113 [Pitangus sulphuratus]